MAYDNRPLTEQEQQFLLDHNAVLAPSLDYFFEHTTAILPSPGIDIIPHRARYQGTWIAELDLFYTHFKKPIIAITGSVGKTTVTSIITQLLQQAGWRIQAAGNIGTPMLEFIDQQNNLDGIVLEVSSFQLEQCSLFAPHLAIWTNFFPNHLDRHGTLDSYFDAKYVMIKNQSKQDYALLPVELRDQIIAKHPQSQINFFSPHGTSSDYTIDGTTLMHASNKRLIALDELPAVTFNTNWLIAYAALDILGVPAQPLQGSLSLEHRLEKVAVINGVPFYNDSKSTIPESTLAAINSVSANRILLFLGGLSKGVDRSVLIKSLTGKNIQIFCFGVEANTLHSLCIKNKIASSACATLDEAFMQCTQQLKTGDCVLFSPAGSSYDLFIDYQDRGASFKKQVLSYKSKVCSSNN